MDGTGCIQYLGTYTHIHNTKHTFTYVTTVKEKEDMKLEKERRYLGRFEERTWRR